MHDTSLRLHESRMANQRKQAGEIGAGAESPKGGAKTLGVLVAAPTVLFSTSVLAPEIGKFLASFVFIVCTVALFVPVKRLGTGRWRASAYIAIVACIAVLVAVYHLSYVNVDRIN